LAVGTYTASGNSLLEVGMPCAFYSQQYDGGVELLGLQIKQTEDEIFFNQSKYIKEMLKKFGLEDSIPSKMPMSMEIKLTKEDESNFVDSSKYQCAIVLRKNPIQHSRTKHIEIRHHFLRDNVQKGNISIKKAASEDNIADIFTKPLKRKVFNYFRLGLRMMELVMDSDSPSSQKYL
nr:retrovirus-related Pol polyprotein from transposon TNT 1-94 [Tanacetum cinerariifolium]